MDGVTWEAATGVATVVGAVAILLLFWQVKVAGKALRLSALQVLFDQTGERELRDLRARIIGGDSFDPDSFAAGDLSWVAGTTNRAGYLAWSGLVDERIVRDQFGSTAEQLWGRMSGWVDQRRSGNQDPLLFGSFEWLATGKHPSERAGGASI